MSETLRELTPDELDAIGEIMNISMGAAATAVSTMLEKQVTITTPRMEQSKFKDIDSSNLEPALIVKIKYTEGIEGTNTTMLRRHDMQVILDILMGNDMPSNGDDFEFDEMSMSAACEVMNQMMGASATALSEIMDMPINISTPEAILVESTDELEETFLDIRGEEPVVAISFKMMIKDVLDTQFISFLPIKLAAKIIDQLNSNVDEAVVEAPEPPVVPQPQFVETPLQQEFTETVPPQIQPLPQSQPVQPPAFENQMPAEQYASPNNVNMQPQEPEHAPRQFNAQPIPPQAPQMQQQPQMPPQNMGMPPQNMGMPPQGAYQVPQGQMNYGAPQGYPGYDQMSLQYMQQQQNMGYGGAMGYQYPSQGGYTPPPVSVKKAEFPDFSQQAMRPISPSGSNMGLLMGVQLEISVIIGRSKRKIKDIMEFGQGTVVELDKQTGAPAEIVVNGQLLAYGDVIVVGDNFGVRITEIVGSKELMDILSNNI